MEVLAWKDHAVKSPVLFDLDETLFSRTASVRVFVEHQFSGKEIGNFTSLDALCDRFMMLDARGSVSKTIVYKSITQEMGLAATMTDERFLRNMRRTLGDTHSPSMGCASCCSGCAGTAGRSVSSVMAKPIFSCGACLHLTLIGWSIHI